LHRRKTLETIATIQKATMIHEEFFFQIHDPTTLNRRGNDLGTSHRSAIYFTSDEQKAVALDTIADVDASGLWPDKVVTEVEPVGDFWEAEPEHQGPSVIKIDGPRSSVTQRDDKELETLTAPNPRPLSSSVVRKIFRNQLGNTRYRFMHNHPSGDPTPSRADVEMTRAIVEVARPLGIAVHDHIIVGKDGHASLKALKLI
jgi:hypothetical protein